MELINLTSPITFEALQSSADGAHTDDKARMFSATALIGNFTPINAETTGAQVHGYVKDGGRFHIVNGSDQEPSGHRLDPDANG